MNQLDEDTYLREYRAACDARNALIPVKRCSGCGFEISIINDTGVCGFCVGNRRKAKA